LDPGFSRQVFSAWNFAVVFAQEKGAAVDRRTITIKAFDVMAAPTFAASRLGV